MKGIWATSLDKQLNVTVGFNLDLEKEQNFTLEIAAGAVFKLYVDGEVKYFGPMRAAHGYARVHKLNLFGRKIAVVVNNPGIKTFCWLKEKPYFACNITTIDKFYTQDNFNAYEITDRVRKVLRYSYQRAFSEVYNFDEKFEMFLNCDSKYMKIGTKQVEVPIMLNKTTNDPTLEIVDPINLSEGYIVKTEDNNYPKQRYLDLTESSFLDGFRLDEIEDNHLATYWGFKHTDNESDTKYILAEFTKSYTGFITLKVKINKPGDVFVGYEELIGENNTLNVLRNETLNVCKWHFDKEGEYEVSTFEPYTAHYVEIVLDGGNDALVSIMQYVNPDADNLVFSCDDDDINSICEAARESFRSNAVDLLTDCPSRERSGWLSDSYFSGYAERLFTGKNLVEEAFIENYLLSYKKSLPKGMIPMNYPSDDYDGVYIPNWAFWFIKEIIRIYEQKGYCKIVEDAKSTVENIFEFFSKYENEDGVLENLESWVFVEWSAANNQDHVCGVNVPSNIQYLSLLRDAGKIYENNSWIDRAEIVSRYLLKHAFKGKLLVDNLIRSKSGKLVQTNNITEVCQYYAFWFKFITKESHPKLYELLMTKLGRNRKGGFMKNVTPPNVMYGIYMRLDLLMREGKRKELLEEIKFYFTDMAKLTGTLWEHNSTFASLNHAFASYSIKWILYAVCGFNADTNTFENDSIGLNYQLKLPFEV